MTLLQLKYFQTLAYILHYTRASEALHISQPSLSYGISELEKELGFPLFARENRKVVLTDYGKEFLPYVEKALDLISLGAEKLKSIANKDGNTVRLGYFYSISADFIPNMINQLYFDPKSKEITFTFEQDLSRKILEMIKNDDVDLGFSMQTAEDVSNVPLFYQPLFLVVANTHPLAKLPSVSTIDIIKEPIIVLDEDSNLRSVVNDIYNKVNAIPNVAFEVKECNAALQFVARGMGISILPHVPAVEAIPVKFIPINETSYRRMVYLIWNKKKELSSASQHVRDFLINNYCNV